jgi:hypothetical protein
MKSISKIYVTDARDFDTAKHLLIVINKLNELIDKINQIDFEIDELKDEKYKTE